MRRARIPAALVLALSLLGHAAAADESLQAVAPAGRVERVALDDAGVPADDTSTSASLSADGRFVAFQSSAGNLTPHDTAGHIQVYVRDRVARTTELVSMDIHGAPAPGDAYNPRMSADGRYVVFGSIPPLTDTTETFQLYRYDRLADEIMLVSSNADGEAANRSVTGGQSSADNRFVALSTSATNLVPSAVANGFTDVFVKDLATGEAEHVSVASDGTPGDLGSLRPAISADGSRVAFQSLALNLDERLPVDANVLTHDVFLRDRVAGTTTKVSVASDGTRSTSNSYCPEISDDGRLVSFPSASANLVPADSNQQWDFFVRDVDAGRTERVSLAHDGRQGQGDFFFSCGHDISGDGRFVAFHTVALDLVPGESNPAPDVFVHDRFSGLTEKVSVAGDGTQGNASSGNPALDADGSVVAFGSQASNLVPGDRPDDPFHYEIFVRDRGPLLGIGEITTSAGGTVSGWGAFAPVVVSHAAATTSGAPTDAAGLRLRGAAVTVRPFRQDVAVRWELEGMAAVRGFTTGLQGYPVSPGAAVAVPTGLDFAVEGQAYRLQAVGASAAGRFELSRCAPDCTLVAEVEGTIGIAGERVTAAIPADTLPLDAGAEISAVTAWVGPGAVRDELVLPDWVMPHARVELAVGDAAPFDQHVIPAPDGRFSAQVPAGRPVRARACLGDVCSR